MDEDQGEERGGKNWNVEGRERWRRWRMRGEDGEGGAMEGMERRSEHYAGILG